MSRVYRLWKLKRFSSLSEMQPDKDVEWIEKGSISVIDNLAGSVIQHATPTIGFECSVGSIYSNGWLGLFGSKKTDKVLAILEQQYDKLGLSYSVFITETGGLYAWSSSEEAPHA